MTLKVSTMESKKGRLIQSYLHNWGVFGFCAIAWLVLIPAIPLVVLGLVPLYLWRQLVVCVAKLWRKDLMENLKFHDMVFALDKFYTRPYASTAKLFVLEGQMTLEELKSNFLSNVLNKEVPVTEKSAAADLERGDNVRLKFQRLQQIPVSFGLFYFWKQLKSLNVDLHFSHLNPNDDSNKGKMQECITRSTVCQYMSELMTKPYPVGSALWEVVLVSNLEEGDKCAVILRLHHILADGYTFNNIVDAMIGQTSLYTVKEDRKMTRREQLNLLWKAPAWTIKLGIEELFTPKNWTSRSKKSSKGVLCVTKIPLDTLKTIRKKVNCHFATVGLCISLGALRRLFLEEHGTDELPHHLKIMHFLPKPAHPMDRMCNHWRVGPLKVFFDTPSALERLVATEAYFRDYTENQFDKFMDFQCGLASLIPAPFYRLFLGRNYSTNMAYTSLPGYHGPSELWGHQISDIYKICGLQYRQTALAAAAYSHNGTVAYSVFANQDVVPTAAAMERLTEIYVHEELQQLMKELEIDSSPA